MPLPQTPADLAALRAKSFAPASLAEMANWGMLPDMTPQQRRVAIAAHSTMGGGGPNARALEAFGSLAGDVGLEDLLPVEKNFLGLFGGGGTPIPDTVSINEWGAFGGRQRRGKQRGYARTTTETLGKADKLKLRLLQGFEAGAAPGMPQGGVSEEAVLGGATGRGRIGAVARYGQQAPTTAGLAEYLSALLQGQGQSAPTFPQAGGSDFEAQMRALYSGFSG